MLVTAAVFATTLLVQQPVDKSTLELYQGRFVLRTPTELVRVPLRVEPELVPAVMFRRGDSYAVWDERGLTARGGKWSFTSKLKEFPTSSRFFKRQEILATLEAVKKGTRTLEATSLSGAKRLGNNAYFLARWDDSAGKPWLEALVSVDLNTPKPKPQIVGQYEGMSLGRMTIDDRLFLRGEAVTAVVQAASGWGLARYEPKNGSFAFQKLGAKVLTYDALTQQRGLLVEETGYGTCMASVIDLASGKKDILYQGRGTARFVDALEPRIVVASTPQGRVLVNTATGAQGEVGQGDVRRAGKYVIVWSQTSATAYEIGRWGQVASWSKPK